MPITASNKLLAKEEKSIHWLRQNARQLQLQVTADVRRQNHLLEIGKEILKYHVTIRGMEICLALNQVKSPTNVGILIRSFVAFGGKRVVFVGYELPWEFKKGSEAFSRKLERSIEIVHCVSEAEFFDWSSENLLTSLALEISNDAKPLSSFQFPERVVVVLGSEKVGLSEEFVGRCSESICIEQSGKVGSLNLSAAGSIACHAYSNQYFSTNSISGAKFVGEGK